MKSPNPVLAETNQSQKERLSHIDFKLFFLGTVNRNDLVSKFGIKEAAASRDLSLYKEIAPKNIEYDTSAKTYVKSEVFTPIFQYSGSQTLSALLHGFGDDFVGIDQPLVDCESPTKLNYPDLSTLAEITRAIFQKKAISIKYRSLSSGLSTREIVPFALVDNGLRWHVRGFDRAKSRFADFVINRIEEPTILDAVVPDDQKKSHDNQWNRIVDLEIVPHPRLKHPKTIEAEYCMQGGVLIVQVRAAVAGYVLRHWGVDCSNNHVLDGPENHLWLRNNVTLYGVENLVLAPGHESTNSEAQHGG